MIHCLPTFLKKEERFTVQTYNRWKNCWDIVLKQGNFGEQNIPQVGMFIGWKAAQQCMKFLGEGKLNFSLFKSAKSQKGPLGLSLSTTNY